MTPQQEAAMRIALNWYDNGNERRDEFKKMIKQILEQSADESVALQMDVIVGNLVREGINKHRARELAEHFIKYTRPQAPEAKPHGEPLTDAEIYELADDGVFLGNVKEITRAIEAAHGIGEKK